jgi:hypothetical protein
MSSEKVATANLQVVGLVIAAALPTIAYALQGALGLSFADEGFLWYGSQRVMAGEVPIRDFMAYDIGRYYWSATVMELLNSRGILAMRISNVMLQTMAMLFATYLVIRRTPRLRLSFAVLAAGTLMLWMLVNDFKIADYLASIVLIFALSLILELPSLRHSFVCGCIVGFVAILGRNHGVYGAVASVGAIGYLAYRKEGERPLRLLVAWSAGVFVGYLPMIVALFVVPEFANSFWESAVKTILETKTTNISVPWPRPWWAHFDSRHYWPDELRHVILGLLFIALPLFGLAGLFYIAQKRSSENRASNPVFISAVLLALPYAHYAFSRADIAHLSFGIFPLLIGAMTSPFAVSTTPRLALVISLFAASLFVVLPYQSGYRALLAGNWQTVTVGSDTLKVAPETASEVALLVTLADRYAPNGRSFVATWPGVYALLERRSPTWEIYVLYPRDEEFQLAEIARIKAANPGFVFVTDWALDGNEKYRYGNSHSLIDRYINATFQPLNAIEVNSQIRILIYVSSVAD